MDSLAGGGKGETEKKKKRMGVLRSLVNVRGKKVGWELKLCEKI